MRMKEFPQITAFARIIERVSLVEEKRLHPRICPGMTTGTTGLLTKWALRWILGVTLDDRVVLKAINP